MHGLVNRALQRFLIDVYGADLCQTVLSKAGCDPGTEFDVLGRYDKSLTMKIVEVSAEQLSQTIPDFLEDLGVYLASHENSENVRRLLRFGGDSFREFLHSLTELHERVLLAVDDLEFPEIDLRQHDHEHLTLSVSGEPQGIGYVLAGVLRAMADDYGTLAMFENVGRYGQTETISVRLLDAHYSAGQAVDMMTGLVGASQ